MGRRILHVLAVSLAALLAPGNWLWAEDSPPAQASAQASAMTNEQLETLVAPIALYPDQLLSQILVASTYPLELVQAYQWQQQHTDLQGETLTTAAAQQSWDPSVQALVAFPEVLKRLNQDVTWTTNLGNAFLARQNDVMDAVQRMRAKAQDLGKLNSTPQQTVTDKTEEGKRVIEIQPNNPDVVYVPVYDPVWIWGPPVYYYYPAWYWPPSPPIGVWCYWGPAIHANFYFGGWRGWAGWGWHPWWFHRTVVVNNVFIAEHHFNPAPVNTFQGRTVWVHQPGHRMGVAYPTPALYHQYRAPVIQHLTVPQVQQRFHQSTVHFNAAHPDYIGGHPIAPGVYNHNRSMFGGVESGANARIHSNRGFSSMQHMPPTGAPGAHPGGHPGNTHGGHAGGGGHGGSFGSGTGHSGGGWVGGGDVGHGGGGGWGGGGGGHR